VVVLMPTKKPTLGESLGSLVASVVDASLSCCEALKGGAGAGKAKGKGTGVIGGKVTGGGGGVPDTGGEGPEPGEDIAWTIGVRLGCAPGSTGTPGETMVNLTVPANYPTGLPLSAPKMTAVPPGLPVPPSSYSATAPSQAPMGTTAIRVSIGATLPRGLYLGELHAMLPSGVPGARCPVVIYLDGLT
jgi:hypothetical protein